MMPPALFFLLKIALTIWGLLWFYMNFNTVFSMSVKNAIGMLKMSSVARNWGMQWWWSVLAVCMQRAYKGWSWLQAHMWWLCCQDRGSCSGAGWGGSETCGGSEATALAVGFFRSQSSLGPLQGMLLVSAMVNTAGFSEVKAAVRVGVHGYHEVCWGPQQWRLLRSSAYQTTGYHGCSCR